MQCKDSTSPCLLRWRTWYNRRKQATHLVCWFCGCHPSWQLTPRRTTQTRKCPTTLWKRAWQCQWVNTSGTGVCGNGGYATITMIPSSSRAGNILKITPQEPHWSVEPPPDHPAKHKAQCRVTDITTWVKCFSRYYIALLAKKEPSMFPSMVGHMHNVPIPKGHSTLLLEYI